MPDLVKVQNIPPTRPTLTALLHDAVLHDDTCSATGSVLKQRTTAPLFSDCRSPKHLVKTAATMTRAKEAQTLVSHMASEKQEMSTRIPGLAAKCSTVQKIQSKSQNMGQSHKCTDTGFQ